jgi:hypothetical protein
MEYDILEIKRLIPQCISRHSDKIWDSSTDVNRLAYKKELYIKFNKFFIYIKKLIFNVDKQKKLKKRDAPSLQEQFLEELQTDLNKALDFIRELNATENFYSNMKECFEIGTDIEYPQNSSYIDLYKKTKESKKYMKDIQKRIEKYIERIEKNLEIIKILLEDTSTNTPQQRPSSKTPYGFDTSSAGGKRRTTKRKRSNSKRSNSKRSNSKRSNSKRSNHKRKSIKKRNKRTTRRRH